MVNSGLISLQGKLTYVLVHVYNTHVHTLSLRAVIVVKTVCIILEILRYLQPSKHEKLSLLFVWLLCVLAKVNRKWRMWSCCSVKRSLQKKKLRSVETSDYLLCWEILFIAFTRVFIARWVRIIRPHRSTMYIDATCCYRCSSVVCQSVGRSVCHNHEPCQNGWNVRDVTCFMDSGEHKEPCIR